MDNISKMAWIGLILLQVIGRPLLLQAAMPLTEQATLVQSDGGMQKLFGSSVCIDGNQIAVGVIGDSAGVYSSGAVIPFQFDGTTWNQEPKIIASKLVAYGNFGNAVALKDQFLAVGAPGDDQHGGDSGAVYMYSRKDGAWVSDVKLISGDAATGDSFGSVLALDNSVLLVGAYADDDSGGASGSAYIFNREGSNWKEAGKLVPSDGASEDYFGKAVSLHATTAVIGAPGDDGVVSDAGSVYVFTNRSDGWIQSSRLVSDKPQTGSGYGTSVSVWGSYIAVGAPGESGKFPAQGVVYLYVFDGTDWVLKSKLLAFDGKNGDAFGKTVSLSGDYLVIGAPSRDEGASETGLVHVYQLISGSWLNTGKYLPMKPASNDEFGQALMTDGRQAIVGVARRDVSGADSGAAYLFDLALIPTLTPTPTYTKPKPPTAIPTFTPSPVPTDKPTVTPTPVPVKVTLPQPATPVPIKPTQTPFNRLDE